MWSGQSSFTESYKLIDQFEPMPRQKRQDAIESLLQVLVGINRVVQVRRFFERPLVPAHRLASDFGAHLR